MNSRDPLKALLPVEQLRRIPQDRWERLGPQQRIEELTSHSLDKCRDILDLPTSLALKSSGVMNAQVQVIRAIFNAVTRVGVESSRLRAMQDEVLTKLMKDFDAAERPGIRSGGNGHSPPAVRAGGDASGRR